MGIEDRLSYEFIYGHLPVLVMEKEIDRYEIKWIVDPTVSTKRIPADRGQLFVKPRPDGFVEPLETSGPPREILGEAARVVFHGRDSSI